MIGVISDKQSRRDFMKRSAGFVAASVGSAILVPVNSFARAQESVAIDLWPGPNDIRQIWIKRRGTGEEGVLRYFDGQKFDQASYRRACGILRDVRANVTAEIDVGLLDLMFVMQKWLVSWGIDRPLLVNSGFRTKATNDRTEGSARNSMHLVGRAADVAMEGIPADYLGRLAGIFRKGGVGFYASNGFVHIDTGAVRYWSGDRYRR
jgi:uncharacterized protein YcbK (DUF882 family)